MVNVGDLGVTPVTRNTPAGDQPPALMAPKSARPVPANWAAADCGLRTANVDCHMWTVDIGLNDRGQRTGDIGKGLASQITLRTDT